MVSWEEILEALQRISSHANIMVTIQSKYNINQPSASSDSDRPEVLQSLPTGVFPGSVSARPIHSLEEQLSKFTAELLDSPCVNSHLVKLSQSIAEWQDLSPYIQLTLAEEMGILTASPQVSPIRQCTEMFRIWRERLGPRANYR